MKRWYFLFSIFAVLVNPVWAYSTCETRVDNNPGASAPQRVMYCLNEEDPYTVQPVAPRVLYTEVMLEEEKPRTTQTKTSDNNPYFKMDKYSVTRDYVGTAQFPEFQNSLLSEQEIWAANHPVQQQPQQTVMYVEETREQGPQWQEPVSYQTTTTTTTTKKKKSSVKETRAGLSRRMKKAQRKDVTQAVPQTQETVATTTTTVTEQYPATNISNPYAVPVETDNFLEQENKSVPAI